MNKLLQACIEHCEPDEDGKTIHFPRCEEFRTSINMEDAMREIYKKSYIPFSTDEDNAMEFLKLFLKENFEDLRK